MTAAAVASWVFFSVVAWQKFARVLQAERYHTDAYFGWVVQGGGARVFFGGWPDVLLHATAFLSLSMLPMFPGWAPIPLSAAAVGWAALRFGGEKGSKKPFVYTARIKRLFAATVIVQSALFLVAWRFFRSEGLTAAAVLAGYMEPFILAVGNVVSAPVERALQEGFKREARRRLAGKTVVAITGSYGKTSTKEAVAHLLETSFPVFKTPGSFNTPMGLCKVVNESLEAHHEIIVVEMGATRKGDVRELCEIALPSVGVVTSVGSAHMETFGSEENTAAAKFELADALPPGGALIFNSDYPLARDKARGRPQKTATYGLEAGADFTPLNIRCDRDGTTFDLKTPAGFVEGVRIRPLGRLNALNVAAAFAVGTHFGIPPDRLRRAAATLPQTQARMELMENRGSYLVINDGFNSNPVGAASALETLSLFDGYKKILVTPGLVDLGPTQETANFEFGQMAATHCDMVLLINERRTRPIYEGLMKGGFPPDKAAVFPSLALARVFLKDAADEKCVVLFENDLPDHMEKF
ncbi:MAG: UDP-N-acetylmuramoyl-tripeptide--D-alanyl-D-alanine ligase [Nitrospinae bacterium]|nr:UDP-N-acetylmuramoyl-tripeptide--D-alanyl-D-alanine ligase [Nitrospinota bacterium]